VIVYAIIESETKVGAVYALERRALPPEAIRGYRKHIIGRHAS